MAYAYFFVLPLLYIQLLLHCMIYKATNYYIYYIWKSVLTLAYMQMLPSVYNSYGIITSPIHNWSFMHNFYTLIHHKCWRQLTSEETQPHFLDRSSSHDFPIWHNLYMILVAIIVSLIGITLLYAILPFSMYVWV